MKTWLLRHVQVLLGSFGRLVRTPVSSTLTLLVIGITLALPASLYVVIENAQRLAGGFSASGQVSLFLKDNVDERQARSLADRIRTYRTVASVQFVSRSDALAEFKRHSGLESALESLGENPLPATLIVRPARSAKPAEIVQLRDALAELKGVDSTVVDSDWIRRLHAMLALAERGVTLLSGFLAVGVLLIVGNTIRLAVLDRQTEIEVIQLVGGTAAFIRRPFLYTGLIEGLLGGLTAWLIVEISILALSGPVRDLAQLYGSEFRVTGIGIGAGMVLAGSGAALGWLGSRIAVGWHLSRLTSR